MVSREVNVCAGTRSGFSSFANCILVQAGSKLPGDSDIFRALLLLSLWVQSTPSASVGRFHYLMSTSNISRVWRADIDINPHPISLKTIKRHGKQNSSEPRLERRCRAATQAGEWLLHHQGLNPTSSTLRSRPLCRSVLLAFAHSNAHTLRPRRNGWVQSVGIRVARKQGKQVDEGHEFDQEWKGSWLEYNWGGQGGHYSICKHDFRFPDQQSKTLLVVNMRTHLTWFHL